MKTEFIATNARTLDRPTGTAIWLRDEAGNEIEIVLNERLTKRVIGSQVDAALAVILEDLTPVAEALREKTDAAETSLREIHNTLFSILRSEIGIRKARNLEETTESTSGLAEGVNPSAKVGIKVTI